MTAKPICKRCGKPHWGFVHCSQAEAVAQREASKANERAKTMVVPVPKHDRLPTRGLRNYVQVGQRFVRERKEDA